MEDAQGLVCFVRVVEQPFLLERPYQFLGTNKGYKPKWAHRNMGEVTKKDLDFFFERPETFDITQY